jgi:glucose/arabinose dehydrogenase
MRELQVTSPENRTACNELFLRLAESGRRRCRREGHQEESEQATFLGNKFIDFLNGFTKYWSMKKIILSYFVPAIAATVTSVLSSFSAFAVPGDIYDGETGNGTILKITPSGTKFTFATGLNFPAEVAFDAASNVYVADINTSILKITLDGVKTNFATGFSQPWGLAFDSVGNLFLADRGLNTIF